MGLPQRPHCPWSGADGDQEMWGLGASTALVLEPSRGPRSSPYPAARGGRGTCSWLLHGGGVWSSLALSWRPMRRLDSAFLFSVHPAKSTASLQSVNRLGGGRLASIDF